MRDNLKQRIEEVYKSGRAYDRDEDTLFGEEYNIKIASAIKNIAKKRFN